MGLITGSSTLQVPTASSPWLGQPYPPYSIPATTIDQYFDLINQGTQTPDFTQLYYAFFINRYIKIELHRPTIPDGIQQVLTFHVNLWFLGYQIAYNPGIYITLWTDFPTPLAAQIGKQKKLAINTAGAWTVGSRTWTFPVDSILGGVYPSGEQIKKAALVMVHAHIVPGQGTKEDPTYP